MNYKSIARIRIVGMSMASLVAACAGVTTPTLEDAANLGYHGIEKTSITLKDGVYQGAPYHPGGAARPRVTLVRELSAQGDLNGDGNKEMAVLLAANSSGSGVFTYVAVLGQHDGRLQNLGTYRLGDRVQIRHFAISKQSIAVDLVAAGAKDAACCPTEKRHIVLRLKDRELSAVKAETTGKFKLTDLEGVTWRLVRLGREVVVPKSIDVTATFQKGQVNGSAGCNRYFGNFSGTPYELKAGPFGATRRMCEPAVMAVEDPFLRALGSVTRVSFHLGQLALTYKTEKGVETLFFVPAL